MEEIKPELTAEENIKQLCFTAGSILYQEFDHIFSDLFYTRNLLYRQIIEILVDGSTEQQDISARLEIKHGGNISEYLDDLVKAGFIARDFTWLIKNGRVSKLSKYRLKDNYTRFYLKYILPNKAQIESGSVINYSLTSLPGWHAIMGLQLENLILSNKDLIKAALKISPEDIVCDNPFFQRKTTKQEGCQIDYLIQIKLNTLFICEIKFSKNEIPSSIIDEVREKIGRLHIPKHFSYRPVLIHVNGVSEQVEDNGYFAKIINFAELIENSNDNE